MPLYSIRRSFPGATATDLEAASLRGLMCAPYYENFRWLRSYYDEEREETICIYEAKDEQDIRLHAERAQMPCDEVRLVSEILPAQFVAPAAPVGAGAGSPQ